MRNAPVFVRRDSVCALAALLADEAKAILLKAAIWVAAADGDLSDEEMTVCSVVADGLAMSSAQVESVFAEMAESS